MQWPFDQYHAADVMGDLKQTLAQHRWQQGVTFSLGLRAALNLPGGGAEFL